MHPPRLEALAMDFSLMFISATVNHGVLCYVLRMSYRPKLLMASAQSLALEVQDGESPCFCSECCTASTP